MTASVPKRDTQPGEKTKAAPAVKKAKPTGDTIGPAPPTLWGVALGGVGALLALLGLLASQQPEDLAAPSDSLRLAVLGLLLVGPGALFWAVGRALRLGAFWLFGTAAWALCGYVLIFVPPPASATAAPAALIGFLTALFTALVAGLTPLLYALGWLLFTRRIHRQDLMRALRQAMLLSLGLVGCLGMQLFGLLNALNALLLFVVLALVEFFFLAKD